MVFDSGVVYGVVYREKSAEPSFKNMPPSLARTATTAASMLISLASLTSFLGLERAASKSRKLIGFGTPSWSENALEWRLARRMNKISEAAQDQFSSRKHKK